MQKKLKINYIIICSSHAHDPRLGLDISEYLLDMRNLIFLAMIYMRYDN